MSAFPTTLGGWMQIAVYGTILIGATFGGTAFLLTRNSGGDEIILERLNSIIETQGDIKNKQDEIRNDLRDLQGDVDGLKVDTGELKTDVQWLKLLLPNTRADTNPPPR